MYRFTQQKAQIILHDDLMIIHLHSREFGL